MSDSPSISLSYSTQGQPARASATAGTASASDAPRVAFATCELVPVNAQMTLMINRENGRQQLIAPTVVEALKTCTRFNS